MSQSWTIFKSLRNKLFAAACMLLAAYFAYHAVQGDYGWLALQQLRSDAVELNGELAALRSQRAAMEHQVSLLRPESLDPDLLDERVRATINLAHPDDLTVLRNGR